MILVQLLKSILIVRGAKMEQKQKQRYLEPVNIKFLTLPGGAAPGLKEAKVQPCLLLQAVVIWSLSCSLCCC